jgi:hypothetical protein
MLSDFLQGSKSVLARYGSNLSAASRILNDLYGPALKAYGVGRIVTVSAKQVTLTVHGRRAKGGRATSACVAANAGTVDVSLDKIGKGGVKAAAKALERALASYVPDGDGAYVWIVPDGYMAALSANEERFRREGGGYFSHESMCVQNTGMRPTRCELTVYFEAPGRKVLRHAFHVPAQRSIHLRLDKIPGMRGEPFIPKSTPVGYKIVSYDAPVVVQGSRILTSGRGSEFASFGTTMAWAPK